MSEQHSSKAVERFVFFSDAVFAFALTLLAVELKLPPHDHHLGQSELVRALSGSIPPFLCYVVSFWVVASLWKRHHRLFEHVRNYDERLIRLNFVLLFFVSLTPFTVELFTAAPAAPLALESYCGLLCAIGLASFALWWKLQRTPGLVPDSERLRGRVFWLEAGSELTMPLLAVGMGFAAIESPERFAYLAAAIGVGTVVVKRGLRRAIEAAPKLEAPPAA